MSRLSIMSKMIRVHSTAVNRLAIRPTTSVTAKPLIGPVPNWNRNAALMSVVMCASKMVRNARSNPSWTAWRIPRWWRSSSRMRSKMSTFASTDMPIVSTMPAMPGSVRVAPNPARHAIR